MESNDDSHLNSVDEKLDRFNQLDGQDEDNTESNYIVKANELR